MKIDIRPQTKTERMYSYSQSRQIVSQTGGIGHLRVDMGSNEKSFFSSWENHRGELKTDEFKAEFDEVINALRFDEQFGGMLEIRQGLETYCRERPESVFENKREFGFRADTEKFSYFLWLNPNAGEYNLYCYCYRRDWLTHHLECASRGIRFIDPSYNVKIKLPDGGRIRVTYSNGEKRDFTCRYIDDYHFEAEGGSRSLFHICEFAELMEHNGSMVEPLDTIAEIQRNTAKKERGEAR